MVALHGVEEVIQTYCRTSVVVRKVGCVASAEHFARDDFVEQAKHIALVAQSGETSLAAVEEDRTVVYCTMRMVQSDDVGARVVVVEQIVVVEQVVVVEQGVVVEQVVVVEVVLVKVGELVYSTSRPQLLVVMVAAVV